MSILRSLKTQIGFRFFIGLIPFIANFAFAGLSPANTQAVNQALSTIALSSNGQSTMFDLGVNDQGVLLKGLKIGNGPVASLVVATHHGNEYGSTYTALSTAKALAEAPIDGMTVYVVPVLNQPGYDSRARLENRGGRRIDPNRDYPGPCGTEGPHALKSTSLIAQFMADKSVVTALTLHTFYPAVVYPWGLPTSNLSTPYDALFKTLVAMATQESQYPTGNNTDLIYPAIGTFEDYAFWKHGIWALLFELGSSHYPSDGDLTRMAQVNVPGIRRVLEQAPRQRATDHAFKGSCDSSLLRLDRREE